MNKPEYYTPDPTEFHDGFEYEWLNEARFIKWEKRIYSVKLYLDELEGSLRFCVRVKYLSRECIQNTGWIYDRNFEHVELFSGMKNNRQQNVMLLFVPLTNWVCIYNKERESEKSILFDGEIKNKSELIRIMNMCKITKIETNEKD